MPLVINHDKKEQYILQPFCSSLSISILYEVDIMNPRNPYDAGLRPRPCIPVQGIQEVYTISGGYCVIESKEGPVVCNPPIIKKVIKPAFCSLAFTSASVITVHPPPSPPISHQLEC